LKLTDIQVHEAQGIIGQVVAGKCPAGVDRDDAKQHLLLVVFENAAKYDPAIAAWSTFVGTIAKRRIIDLGRIQQRRQRFHEKLEASTGDRFTVMNDNAWESIIRHVKKLPPRQAIVIRHRLTLGDAQFLGRIALAEKMKISIERVRQLERSATWNLIKSLSGMKEGLPLRKKLSLV